MKPLSERIEDMIDRRNPYSDGPWLSRHTVAEVAALEAQIGALERRLQVAEVVLGEYDASLKQAMAQYNALAAKEKAG